MAVHVDSLASYQELLRVSSLKEEAVAAVVE
jgi:hypothetical protein